MKKSIIGIVDSQQDTQAIVGDLRRIGFGPNAVSVLYPEHVGDRKFVYRHSTKAPERALAGSGVGGVLGAIAGVLSSFGALTLPGQDMLVAAGPLLAALSCGAAGAALGGIAGAVSGWAIPEIELRRFDGLHDGGSILVAVHVEDDDARHI